MIFAVIYQRQLLLHTSLCINRLEGSETGVESCHRCDSMDSKKDENHESLSNRESEDESACEEESENDWPSADCIRLYEKASESDMEESETMDIEHISAKSTLEDVSKPQSEGHARDSKSEDVKSEEAAQKPMGLPEPHPEEKPDSQKTDEKENIDTLTKLNDGSLAETEKGKDLVMMDGALYGMFPPFLDGLLPSKSNDKATSMEVEVTEPLAVHDQVEYTEEEAFIAGNASIHYLRGIMDHERMNLDDAISNLTKCFEMAVETDLFEYMVKSQVQLASVHIKRYQLHDHKEDYDSALEYSENLIQIGKEQDLHELRIESLVLRAMLRKIAKDFQGAKEDLMEAKKIAVQTSQMEFEFMIKAEMKEVRRLIAGAARSKRLGKDNEERLMREALEKMPAVINGVLRIELTRKARVVPVKLHRLVVMNLPAGLPLYSHNFEEPAGAEEFLVYGLLSALSHLASEVTPDVGRMKTLSHEGQTVIMEHRGRYMAALFASKESFRARQSLERFLREFLRSFPDKTGSGRILTEEQKEAATQLFRRTFRAFLAPLER